MNNIVFRGEINGMSADYFIRQMESLPPRSAANVYIHTPGGEIYSGGEMVNSLRAAVRRGCKISLEIGSLAASMGASLIAAARARKCKVVCHSNSEVMFHGCWAMVVGGADELTDEAKAMRDFNETVIEDLMKCGIEDCEEWFSADRQKWLNAKELLALGLVDSIVENECEDDDFRDVAIGIAAKLNHRNEAKMDEEKNEEAVKPAEEPKTEAAESVEVVEQPAEAPVADEVKPEEPAAPVADDFEKRVADAVEVRFRGLQAKQNEKFDAIKNELAETKASLASVTAERDQLVQDRETLNASLAELRDQLAEKTSALEQSEEKVRLHVGSVLTADQTEEPVVNARAKMAALPPSERAAFYAAHKAEVDSNK